jgi:hypothetical protein
MDRTDYFIINTCAVLLVILGFVSYIVCLVQGDTVRVTLFFLGCGILGLVGGAVNIIADRIAARKSWY